MKKLLKVILIALAITIIAGVILAGYAFLLDWTFDNFGPWAAMPVGLFIPVLMLVIVFAYE